MDDDIESLLCIVIKFGFFLFISMKLILIK